MNSREYFLGNYRIIRVLGRGGFASVYLGEHRYLNTLAAIKVLDKVLDDRTDATGSGRNEFLAEARLIAQLKHPHIIPIIDFNLTDEGKPYLVMEYAPNGTLAERYTTRQVLKPEQVLPWVKQIASALQFAHEQQIVHCDVKPENMLLNSKNEALLADFGIAVVMHATLGLRQVGGTTHYMAPEQFDGKPVPASDQYSLAVAVYRWLCGRFPFNSKILQEMRHLHQNALPPPPRMLNPQLSPALESVLLIALAKDPAQRYGSTGEFAIAFERAIQTKPVQPSPPVWQPPSAQEAAEPLILFPSLSSRSSPSAPTVPATQWPPAPPDQAVPDQAKEPVLAPPQARAVERLLPDPDVSLLCYHGHAGWVSTVAWSPDGRALASGSWDTTVQIWDAASGETLLTYQGHTQPVKCVAWSPDGKVLASGSWDNRVLLWDAATGETRPGGLRHGAQVEAVIWSPDGTYLASAGHDSVVFVWHVNDRQQVVSYRGHRKPIWSLAWSPDGRYIASVSHDKTVQIWEALSGTPVYCYTGHKCQVASVAWSPEGKYIASSDHHGAIHLWSLPNGKLHRCYRDTEGAVKALAWSPDGRYIASAVKRIQVWHSARQRSNSPHFSGVEQNNWINALAWSPNNRLLATASDDRTVQLWDIS